ncbi:hypothetical protein DY000_02060702 [Brassica cretica]|uniref:Small ribosomal subunit protein uS17 N-terminal domain-containing protein n=1 Tax=Brassica cretica TaxID=69181 RepID=A0ABQ7ATQ1_BRACR|nr:hypothetical protein DY000_02060702 [Brassica cretica]
MLLERDGGRQRTTDGEQEQPVTIAEQTEKAFLKQPNVFLSLKKSGKGKWPGKGGNRFWKNIGLGFKTPPNPLTDITLTRNVRSLELFL